MASRWYEPGFIFKPLADNYLSVSSIAVDFYLVPFDIPVGLNFLARFAFFFYSFKTRSCHLRKQAFLRPKSLGFVIRMDLGSDKHAGFKNAGQGTMTLLSALMIDGWM